VIAILEEVKNDLTFCSIDGFAAPLRDYNAGKILRFPALCDRFQTLAALSQGVGAAAESVSRKRRLATVGEKRLGILFDSPFSIDVAWMPS
jgi:hypothetical protein